MTRLPQHVSFESSHAILGAAGVSELRSTRGPASHSKHDFEDSRSRDPGPTLLRPLVLNQKMLVKGFVRSDEGHT